MAIYCENKNGICFDIEIQDANVLQGADYWGYRLLAREQQTQKAHSYLAMIKKRRCRTKEAADRFLAGEPTEYLESALLDAYSDGSTPLLWPDPSTGWVVM